MHSSLLGLLVVGSDVLLTFEDLVNFGTTVVNGATFAQFLPQRSAHDFGLTGLGFRELLTQSLTNFGENSALFVSSIARILTLGS